MFVFYRFYHGDLISCDSFHIILQIFFFSHNSNKNFKLSYQVSYINAVNTSILFIKKTENGH